MTKIRALIVDDEPYSLNMMQGYLADYFPEVMVVGTAESAEDAATKIAKNAPNLLFLDISMPGEDGLQLVERFRNPAFELIFVTAHEEHAVRAFELGALHYLLKPVDIVKLQEAIKRATEVINKKDTYSASTLREQTPARITLANTNENKLVSVSDILYCKADGSYTYFVMRDGNKLTSSYNMGHYEQLLGEQDFFRVHKQYLVNLACVKSYTKGKGGYLEMEDGTTLEISVRRKGEFVDRLTAG